MNSCLMFLPMAAGREIYTVEALAAGGALCDAQAAMAAAGGSQCGYCTPGFVISLFAEQHRPDRAGPCETSALAGNLCRCTGYRPIRDAAASLGPAPPGPFADRLARPTPALGPVTAAAFSRPLTVEACVAILASSADARIVSGGTDLGVESNLRHRRWPHLVSVEAVDELRVFSDGPDRVSIGAALPLAELERLWPHAPAAVREWLAAVRFAPHPEPGDPRRQSRHRLAHRRRRAAAAGARRERRRRRAGGPPDGSAVVVLRRRTGGPPWRRTS